MKEATPTPESQALRRFLKARGGQAVQAILTEEMFNSIRYYLHPNDTVTFATSFHYLGYFPDINDTTNNISPNLFLYPKEELEYLENTNSDLLSDFSNNRPDEALVDFPRSQHLPCSQVGSLSNDSNEDINEKINNYCDKLKKSGFIMFLSQFVYLDQEKNKIFALINEQLTEIPADMYQIINETICQAGIEYKTKDYSLMEDGIDIEKETLEYEKYIRDYVFKKTGFRVAPIVTGAIQGCIEGSSNGVTLQELTLSSVAIKLNSRKFSLNKKCYKCYRKIEQKKRSIKQELFELGEAEALTFLARFSKKQKYTPNLKKYDKKESREPYSIIRLNSFNKDGTNESTYVLLGKTLEENERGKVKEVYPIKQNERGVWDFTGETLTLEQSIVKKINDDPEAHSSFFGYQHRAYVSDDVIGYKFYRVILPGETLKNNPELEKMSLDERLDIISDIAKQIQDFFHGNLALGNIDLGNVVLQKQGVKLVDDTLFAQGNTEDLIEEILFLLPKIYKKTEDGNYKFDKKIFFILARNMRLLKRNSALIIYKHKLPKLYSSDDWLNVYISFFKDYYHTNQALFDEVRNNSKEIADFMYDELKSIVNGNMHYLLIQLFSVIQFISDNPADQHKNTNSFYFFERKNPDFCLKEEILSGREVEFNCSNGEAKIYHDPHSMCYNFASIMHSILSKDSTGNKALEKKRNYYEKNFSDNLTEAKKMDVYKHLAKTPPNLSLKKVNDIPDFIRPILENILQNMVNEELLKRPNFSHLAKLITVIRKVLNKETISEWEAFLLLREACLTWLDKMKKDTTSCEKKNFLEDCKQEIGDNENLTKTITDFFEYASEHGILRNRGKLSIGGHGLYFFFKGKGRFESRTQENFDKFGRDFNKLRGYLSDLIESQQPVHTGHTGLAFT